MALPSQTFPNISSLVAYINTRIKPNGVEEINGDVTNNALNALADFIVDYSVNGTLASIVSSTSSMNLSKAVTVFTDVPSAVGVPDNFQYEYYLINTTPYDIDFNTGFSYFDSHGTEHTSLPGMSVTHIAKAINETWVQVNNLGGSEDGVPNSKVDTPAIDIELSGTLNRIIKAQLNLSEEAGNVAELRSGGLYVPTPAAPPSGAVTGDL